jgi:hypothetical protein
MSPSKRAERTRASSRVRPSAGSSVDGADHATRKKVSFVSSASWGEVKEKRRIKRRVLITAYDEISEEKGHGIIEEERIAVFFPDHLRYTVAQQ